MKTARAAAQRPKARMTRALAVDTAGAILEAAEQLCAERGIESVSMRDIAAAAQVNLSAVNYHFGTRTNLFLTILRTRLAEVEREREILLADVETSERPQLRDILRAVLTPLARWRTPGSRRRASLLFVSRALIAATPELKREVDGGVSKFRRVITLLERALPQISREELCWRFHFMMSIEHMNTWDVERLKILSEDACRAEDLHESLERALDFAEAGFLAPVRRWRTKARTTSHNS